MRTWKLAGRAAAVTLAMVLLGCGGTGTNNQRGVGSVGVTVAWPQRPEGVQPQLIPAASNSIKLEILRDDSTLAEQTVTINRPETHARIDDVRVGDALLRATAYPQPGAEGVAQATAETNITVLADEYHEWPLTLASTIDHVDVEPSPASIDVADTVQLTATAKNADGQTVLVPADAPFDWSVTGGAAQVSVEDSGLVTGTSVGQGSVSAQEGESGVAGTATVTVNPADIIAFHTWRHGNAEIYRMKLDGTQLHNLTNDPGNDVQPLWSPDGSQMAFTSQRSGATRIHIMDADGSNVWQLTSVWGWNARAAWSPDGARIAFHATPDAAGEGNREVFVINADGSNCLRLTDTEDTINDGGPTWSHDGTRIVYHSGVPGDWSICVMDADGSNKITIVDSSASDSWPFWSPDGSKIAFTSTRDGHHEVYTCNLDGSGQTNLTQHPAYDEPRCWSPDASQIVFHSDRSGNWDLYVMNANGTNVRQLTDDPADDLGSSWTVWTALPW